MSTIVGVDMRQRTIPLLLVFSLAAAACGEALSDFDASGPGEPERPTTTVVPVGRGWLEGDDLDWSTNAAGGAATEEALEFAAEPDTVGAGDDAASVADRSEAADVGSSEMSSEIGPIAPPIDDSPLRAGSIDDAEDVPAFLAYRDSIRDAGIDVRPLDLGDSTVFTVMGNNGLPVLGAFVEFWDPAADRSLDVPAVVLRTTAEGSVRFSPDAMAPGREELSAVVRVGGVVSDVGYQRGEPAVAVQVDAPGGVDGSVPLDVLFVLDATGSMGDEIARLRENMTTIAREIAALPSAADVRFGMTVYRDEGDLFVTRTFDLTGDLDAFLAALADVEADGGGDYPEAVDEALADALEKPSWRGDGAVELMFMIADAPPQVSRQVQQPYTATALAAAEAGVKIFPVAASGTDDQAEYVMRDLAFVTGGRFVFLSYGAGGSTATGDRTDIAADDYDELPLDQLVIRLVEDELAALAGGDALPPTSTTLPATTTTYEQ
jgi:von Willebrand factor type A domain